MFMTSFEIIDETGAERILSESVAGIFRMIRITIRDRELKIRCPGNHNSIRGGFFIGLFWSAPNFFHSDTSQFREVLRPPPDAWMRRQFDISMNSMR
jgi:hypothetical protein